jgi:hypothetical protein
LSLNTQEFYQIFYQLFLTTLCLKPFTMLFSHYVIINQIIRVLALFKGDQ